jgi:hypothetical protein
MSTPLTHWLRLLWGRPPELHPAGEVPFIAAGAIHLPACSHWHQQRAAAAHAAAHLVYSPPRFDGTALPPITRTLLALLEDARAEALASRELPGLARLWLPLHTATPDDGVHFETLLQRLARALADPGYADLHPWVAKGRALFYLDPAQSMLALRTPAELRRAASLLGHDIGQMRLQFNAKTYRPAPAYRDDHRWMWDADDVAAIAPPPAPATGAGDSLPETPEAEATLRHPEWDRLIRRLRRDWCTVIERPAPTVPAAAGLQPSFDSAVLQLGRRLHGVLHTLVRPVGQRLRARDGEQLDLDALVRWRVARRLGQSGDTRIYLMRQRQAPGATVWLLVDQSASSASAHGSSVHSLLHAAALSAAGTAQALQRLGVACAISGFSSSGRHAVLLNRVKGLGEAAGADTLGARLRALRSGGSTRLGAVLRHATAQLNDRAAGRRLGAKWVLLLSDAEAHDIDVHDPRYLVEDARHAVRAAARHSVRMACLTLAADTHRDARRIFGPRGAQAVPSLQALPATVRRLLA